MRLNQPLVYLAGPISGLSFDGAADWRTYATELLEHHNITALSPMRQKSFLKGVRKIDANGVYHDVYNTPSGITTRDRNDVMRSDAVLMHLVGAKAVSIGTMIEAGYADAYRRPLVVAMEYGNPHLHPMLVAAAGYVVPTLEEAIDVVQYVVSVGA